MLCQRLSVVAVFATTAVSAQAPSFRTGVELVQVAVVVQDRHGRSVDDLSPDAFEIRDEKVVVIRTFAHVQAGSGSEPTQARADSVLAQGRWSAAPQRAFVILLDDLHTPSRHVAPARHIARRFVEEWVQASDVIAVRRTSQGGIYTLGPAGDRERLLTEIDRFEGHGQEPLHDRERVHRAQQTMDALGWIAQAVGHTPGQQATVLFISEGLDYNVFNVQSGGSADVVRATESAIRAMRRSNVVLYAIDPRGLASSEGSVVETGGAFDSQRDMLTNSRSSLRHLAEETGGVAAINGNDLTRAVDRIGRDISNYYVLGFYPNDQACDGRFRRLRVKVHRPDVRVRARTGYACGGARKTPTR